MSDTGTARNRTGWHPRVLILGGYGHFGERIARALVRHGHSEIWIAGRDPMRAEALARDLGQKAAAGAVRALGVDISARAELLDGFKRLMPALVIHAAGPFQTQDYVVAEACLATKSHYIDLADGRRFVAGFYRLDERARQRELLLVTGASTLPGLSSAVVNLMRHGMQSIRGIAISIAPSGQTPRGRATLEAVLSYCGKPVRMLDAGRWIYRVGWQDETFVRYPHFSRRVAVCDVPDLELFPQYYAGVETVSFHAGPELRCERLALKAMAWLASRGLVRNWARHARLFEHLSRWTRHFGSEVGGMQVTVTGIDFDGKPIERRWDLVAGSNHGYEIPCLPAIALAKKILEGAIETRGAFPCVGLIGLEDFALEAHRFDIDWNLTRVT